MAKYKRFKIYKKENIVRIYFADNSSITLSLKKNGLSLTRKIILQIKESNLKQRNLFIYHDDYVEVVCRNIKGKYVELIKIDYDVYDIIKESYISINHTSKDYAYVYIKDRGYLRLHNFIMGHPEKNGLMVDHINHDTFDNRIKNLRAVPGNINTKNKAFFSSPTSQVPVNSISYGIANRDVFRVRIVGDNDVLFKKEEYKKAVIYCYKRKIEKGYMFKESSTTIEQYIASL